MDDESNSRACSSLKFIPPTLAGYSLAFVHLELELDAPLALDNSLAIDLDVLTTPLPEHD